MGGLISKMKRKRRESKKSFHKNHPLANTQPHDTRREPGDTQDPTKKHSSELGDDKKKNGSAKTVQKCSIQGDGLTYNGAGSHTSNDYSELGKVRRNGKSADDPKPEACSSDSDSDSDSYSKTQDRDIPDFTLLPPIVWVKVMQMVNIPERQLLSSVCRTLHQIFQVPSVWSNTVLYSECCSRRGPHVQPAYRGHGYLAVKECDGEENKERGCERGLDMIMGRYGAYLQHLTVLCLRVPILDVVLPPMLSLPQPNRLRTLKLHVDGGEYLLGMGCDEVFEDSFQAQLCRYMQRFISERPSSRLRLEVEITMIRGSHNLYHHMSSNPAHDLRYTLMHAVRVMGSMSDEELLEQNPLMDGDAIPGASPTTLLVSKFVNLQHLSVNAMCLSVALFRELSCEARRRGSPLRALHIDHRLERGHVPPELPVAAWEQLVAACPQLEVSCQVAVAVGDLAAVFKPGIPLVSTRFRPGPIGWHPSIAFRMLKTAPVVTDQSDTLTTLFFQMPVNEYRLRTPGILTSDTSLVQLVAACPRLVHLTFINRIYSGDVGLLAALRGRRWRTFDFRAESVVTVADGGGAREREMRAMCKEVSACLGYTWKPS